MDAQPSPKAMLTKALALTVLSSFFGALIGAATKYSLQYMSAHVIIFCQYTLGFLFSLPVLISQSRTHSMFRTERLGLHLLRSGAGVLAFYAFFFAIQHISLVSGSLLRNTAPLCVPIIALLAFRRMIPRASWLPLIIGFCGVVLILQPKGGISIWHLIGFCSGFLLGVSMVTTRLLVITEPIARVTCYYFGVGLLVTLPFAVLHWQSAPWHAWLSVLGGGVSITLAMSFYTRAFIHARPSLVAPVSYLGVVFAGCLGWLFWDEVPGLLTLIGIGLVILGAIAVLIIGDTSTGDGDQKA